MLCSSRGKSRNKFHAKDGQEYDIYELLVKSIAENPPIMRLECDEIKKRIDCLIGDGYEKPKLQPIKDSLTKLQELLSNRGNMFKVLEWRDGVLHILDPLFLFYLRWGGENPINFKCSIEKKMREKEIHVIIHQPKIL